MNILVISNTPWSDNNSFGNSFSNIFDGIPNLKFANIYCRSGKPNNQFDMICFQITEKSLISNFFHRKKPSGRIVSQLCGKEVEEKEIVGFEQARKIRWQLMFWGRDIIWKIGRWKSDELKNFLDEFDPDIIFQPIYSKPYINDIVLFAKEYIGCPMIGYISDDNYTLKQFNISPLYWVDRLWSRQKVKKVIEKCKLLYVISQIQKEEYEKIFTPPCKVLTKCADFSNPAPIWRIPTDTIKMIYAGNIGSDRWKSLGILTEVIEKLRRNGYHLQMDIYTSTPMTSKMQHILKKDGTFIHKSVSYLEVRKIQKKADILIHVEGLSLKSQLAVHQSFSTKLVDYFAMGKCIVAVGTEREASIKHLIDNNAAVVIGTKKEATYKIEKLLGAPEMILEYGIRAYTCGKKHHERVIVQKMLLQDLQIEKREINVNNE